MPIEGKSKRKKRSTLKKILRLIENPFDEYSVVELLGEGKYGKVYRAISKKDGKSYAVKVVNNVESEINTVEKEIQILQRCSHPNIVRYYDSFLHKSTNDYWIVLEFCYGGSVDELLNILQLKNYSEKQISAMIKSTLLGLNYLHSLNKIHRDIKSGNILLSKDGSIQLTDFGISSQLDESIGKRKTFIGTPFWMAPEVIEQSGYDTQCDIWSLGITAIELAEGKPPLYDIRPMRAIFLIPFKPVPKLSSGKWSNEFVDFVSKCLKKNPNERWNAKKLLNHPFIKDVENVKEILLPLINDLDEKFNAVGGRDEYFRIQEERIKEEKRRKFESENEESESELESDSEESDSDDDKKSTLLIGGKTPSKKKKGKEDEESDDEEEEESDDDTIIRITSNDFKENQKNNKEEKEKEESGDGDGEIESDYESDSEEESGTFVHVKKKVEKVQKKLKEGVDLKKYEKIVDSKKRAENIIMEEKIKLNPEKRMEILLDRHVQMEKSLDNILCDFTMDEISTILLNRVSKYKDNFNVVERHLNLLDRIKNHKLINNEMSYMRIMSKVKQVEKKISFFERECIEKLKKIIEQQKSKKADDKEIKRIRNLVRKFLKKKSFNKPSWIDLQKRFRELEESYLSKSKKFQLLKKEFEKYLEVEYKLFNEAFNNIKRECDKIIVEKRVKDKLVSTVVFRIDQTNANLYRRIVERTKRKWSIFSKSSKDKLDKNFNSLKLEFENLVHLVAEKYF